MKHFLLVLVLAFFAGCAGVDDSGEVIVAQTFDHTLYRSDLVGLVPPETSGEDSTTIIKNYIRNWTREMAVFHKAESNMPLDQSEIDKRVDAYKKDLIIYEFERALVNQRLDTIVTAEDIDRYFQNNPESFNQRKYMVKALFLKVSKGSPQLEYIQKWYRSHKSDDLKAIQEYASQHGTAFEYNPREWKDFDVLQAKVPVQIPEVDDLVKGRKHFTHDDGRYYYFLNILGYKETEALVPSGSVRDRIRAIIINKRKTELVKRIRQEAYQDALQNHNIEILL